LTSPPATSCTLASNAGLAPAGSCVSETGAEFFVVSDTDGADDDVTSFIIDRNAGYSNAAGIYDPFDVSNTLELWSGTTPAGLGSGVVLEWDGLMYSLATGGDIAMSNALYSAVFGIYLDINNDGTPDYFSDNSLNPISTDGHSRRVGTYETEGTGGIFDAFDIVFGWEDLPVNGTDNDFQDIVFGCIDCAAVGNPRITTNVPVPGTLFLMGAGLFIARRWIPRAS